MQRHATGTLHPITTGYSQTNERTVSERGPRSNNRRLMLRRAALAAFVLLMLTTASVLAAPKLVSIAGSGYSPASITVAMGGGVQWKNTTGKKRTVSADVSFLVTAFWPPKTVRPHTTSTAMTFPEAGTFTYHDSLSATLRGTVAVPMTADMAVISLGNVVTFTLGTVTASSLGPIWHDVQGRVNGGAWMTAGTTGANTTSFKPTSAGTWEFQTRLHHALSGANSGYSPILTITVI
jgi:plastocyanin